MNSPQCLAQSPLTTASFSAAYWPLSSSSSLAQSQPLTTLLVLTKAGTQASTTLSGPITRPSMSMTSSVISLSLAFTFTHLHYLDLFLKCFFFCACCKLIRQRSCCLIEKGRGEMGVCVYKKLNFITYLCWICVNSQYLSQNSDPSWLSVFYVTKIDLND